MKFEFADPSLRRLSSDRHFDGGLPPGVVKAYRKRLLQIQAASDERVFYALKSLHFEKLKGDRRGQHSMRLNDQWRLVLRLKGSGQTKTAELLSIEDYH